MEPRWRRHGTATAPAGRPATEQADDCDPLHLARISHTFGVVGSRTPDTLGDGYHFPALGRPQKASDHCPLSKSLMWTARDEQAPFLLFTTAFSPRARGWPPAGDPPAGDPWELHQSQG